MCSINFYFLFCLHSKNVCVCVYWRAIYNPYNNIWRVNSICTPTVPTVATMMPMWCKRKSVLSYFPYSITFEMIQIMYSSEKKRFVEWKWMRKRATMVYTYLYIYMVFPVHFHLVLNVLQCTVHILHSCIGLIQNTYININIYILHPLLDYIDIYDVWNICVCPFWIQSNIVNQLIKSQVIWNKCSRKMAFSHFIKVFFPQPLAFFLSHGNCHHFLVAGAHTQPIHLVAHVRPDSNFLWMPGWFIGMEQFQIASGYILVHISHISNIWSSCASTHISFSFLFTLYTSIYFNI